MSLATVVSVFPRALVENKPSVSPNEYRVPACLAPDGRGYPDIDPVTVLVPDATTQFYKGWNEWIPAVVPSESLAQDIVRGFVSSNLEVTLGGEQPVGPGLFSVSGSYDREEKIIREGYDERKAVEWVRREFKEELARAHRGQDLWFQLLVRRADDEWNKTKNPRAISDVHRSAAKRLGVEREWTKDIIHQVESKCPACRQNVDPMALVCPVCKHVINPSALKRLNEEQDLFAKVG